MAMTPVAAPWAIWICAALSLSLAGCGGGDDPSPTPAPTPFPTSCPAIDDDANLTAAWGRHLAAFGARSIDDLVCSFAGAAVLIAVSEDDEGKFGGGRKETLADIREFYGGILDSLAEEPVILAQEVGEDVVYFVWSGVTSDGDIYEGSETLGFKDVDGQAKVIYHLAFVKERLDARSAITAKGLDKAGREVHAQANVYLSLYLGWLAEDLDRVMGLFTDGSTMLEYTFGESDGVRTVGGLAGIRSWFEAELATLKDMTEGPSLRASPGELDAGAEVWVGEAQSEILQLAMNLVSRDGSTITHFHVLRNNVAGGAEFMA